MLCVVSFRVQDSSDFSSFQLDRLMKQSQLSQRLESVRQEMNYSAGGVEDILEHTEDTTVESSRLASDDLAHYVLIKGNPDTEDAGTKEDAAASKVEAGAEDSDAEDDEWNPNSKRKSSLPCRMNDQFIIRKIERDRNAGRKFAAVCEVKLSSSGTSSSEEDDDDSHRQRDIVKSSVEVRSSGNVTPPPSHISDGSSTTVVVVAKLADEKRKLPPPDDDVIPAKRWRTEDSSVEDERVAVEFRDKVDELVSEAVNRDKEMNAETGEEPSNGKCREILHIISYVSITCYHAHAYCY